MNDDAWSTPSEAECAVLRGRQAVVDVSHQPTALQVSSRTGVQRQVVLNLSARHLPCGSLP